MRRRIMYKIEQPVPPEPGWQILTSITQLNTYNRIIIESNGYYIGNQAGTTAVTNTQNFETAKADSRYWFLVGNITDDISVGQADKVIQCSIQSDPGNADANSYMAYNSSSMKFQTKLANNIRILQFGSNFSIGNNAKNQYINVKATNTIATSKVPGTAASDAKVYCTIYYWAQ